jgi:hypothetical protein
MAKAHDADFIAEALPAPPEADVAAKGAVGDAANGHFGITW